MDKVTPEVAHPEEPSYVQEQQTRRQTSYWLHLRSWRSGKAGHKQTADLSLFCYSEALVRGLQFLSAPEANTGFSFSATPGSLHGCAYNRPRNRHWPVKLV